MCGLIDKNHPQPLSQKEGQIFTMAKEESSLLKKETSGYISSDQKCYLAKSIYLFRRKLLLNGPESTEIVYATIYFTEIERENK